MAFFIALEGVEGSGKSTQAARLAHRLEGVGIDVVLTREPGGTSRGDAIRALLLDPEAGPLDPRAEALLYAADRADHVAEVVVPALDRGQWVVCDRYSDSYRAYQGGGRELGVEEVGQISTWASGGLEPDLVILLDVPVESGMARIAGLRDRIESAGSEFHTRVRDAFLDLAAREPARFRVVDGDQSADNVGMQIWDAVAPLVESS